MAPLGSEAPAAHSATDGPAPTEFDVARDRVFGGVQRLRADAQALQKALKEVETAERLKSEEARAAEVTKALIRAEKRLRQTEIRRKLERLEESLGSSPGLEARIGDLVTRIRTAMLIALDEWPKADATPDTALDQTRRAADALDDVVMDAALLTMPTRLNEHLKNQRIGDPVEFDEVFIDELPSKARRDRVLKYLASQPAAIGGVIDVDERLVYRISGSKPYRILTYILPGLFAILAGAIFGALGQVDNILVDDDEWPSELDSSRELLAAYIFVLAGALLHLVVDAVKQVRFGQGAPIYAVGDFLLWVHLRWAGLCKSLLPVFVVAIGLRYIGEDDPLTLLFGGYAVDSLAGIILTRFDSSAGRRAGTLVERIRRPARNEASTS